MKKIFFATVVGMMVGVSNADYLYWMVSDTYASTADSAKLVAVSGTETHDLESHVKTDWMNMGEDEAFRTSLGSYTGEGWSYYVEIVNAGKTLQSDHISYSDASQFIERGGIDAPSVLTGGALGQGQQTYNVPEPTSGLLFLVGGMLLGLRRKRRV